MVRVDLFFSCFSRPLFACQITLGHILFLLFYLSFAFPWRSVTGQIVLPCRKPFADRPDMADVEPLGVPEEWETGKRRRSTAIP